MAQVIGLDKAIKNITRKISVDAARRVRPQVQQLENQFKKDRIKGINPKTGRGYKKLKKSTIDRRKALAKVNKTGAGYSAAKSNLTLTGQLIQSISFTVLLRPLLQLKIDVQGNHKPYRGVRGKKVGKTQSNTVIAQGLEDQGRPLVSSSKKLINNFKRLYGQAIRSVLR